MGPNEHCRCRFRYVRHHATLPDHLCANVCPILEHVTDELDYMVAVVRRESVQLRLF